MSEAFRLYGAIQDVRLTILDQPRAAILSFRLDERAFELAFSNPTPLAPLTEVFDDCWEIRVTDRNVEESNQLDFGRFRVELGDEDGPRAEFWADAVEKKP